MLSFSQILRQNWESIVHFFIFLPYYFNVRTHITYLFSPWKRIVGIKKTKGFDWQEWGERVSMSLVSRFIGFIVRSLVIILFLITITFYLLIIVPLWLIIGLILTPFKYLFLQFETPSQKKTKAQKQFVKIHLLEEDNQVPVKAWFERYWQSRSKIHNPFSLENLLAIPPLGRDWAYGFTPTLDDYCTDLTSPLSYKNILLDREEEIDQIERALAKSYEANVVIVGDEGVGRHTIVDGLAQNIYQGKTIPPLQSMRILELNMDKIVAQKHSYEEKATFLEELLLEASAAKNIILVISDFHKYVSEDLVGDFSGVWEKYASRPLIKLLGIVTPFYFEQVLHHNEKLRNLFNKIVVEEIKSAKALLILEEKALIFEQHYHLRIPYESLEQVIKRSQFYITHIPFPEKAISLLDSACVYAKDHQLKEVLPDLIDTVLSEKTRVPVGQLSEQTKQNLLNLEAVLKKGIYGQDQALQGISKAVKRAYIEEKRTKPLVSFMFLGPTGVGKTETAKQLAKIFFGKRDKLIRFDMSFYQNKESLIDLIGSFEGKNPGLLANNIRENPYSVLLIDEIEKANKDILNIFLTLLDEGYLVDGYGEKVDCKNLLFVATSNAGAKEIQAWVKDGQRGESLEKLVRNYVIDQSVFAPEFLNRFDKVLVYEPLDLEVAYKIGRKVSQEVVNEYMAEKDIHLQVGNAEFKQWIKESFNPASGAREIDRVIRENLAEKASSQILSK